MKSYTKFFQILTNLKSNQPSNTKDHPNLQKPFKTHEPPPITSPLRTNIFIRPKSRKWGPNSLALGPNIEIETAKIRNRETSALFSGIMLAARFPIIFVCGISIRPTPIHGGPRNVYTKSLYARPPF